MVDTVRRFLAAGMIAVAVIGLMPLVSIAFGYLQADVSLEPTGTTYPAATAPNTYPVVGTRLVDCEQINGTLALLSNNFNKNKTYYIRCTNNWASPITVRVRVAQANGTGLAWSSATFTTTSISPGHAKCVQVGQVSGNNSLTNKMAAGTVRVVYQGDINFGSTTADLGGTIQFTGMLNFTSSSPAVTCTEF